MGMDPMAMSQGMYGGFGAQGMGINGMNVDMGFNAGQGAFGGFNGQPAAWNAGQDKFNQNSYGAQSTGMVGDFGPSAGYAGYNVPQHQGNFNQMHHQYQNNDFQSGYNSQGFYNRGRGRGRGFQNAGRGRGGFNQVNAGNQANYEPFHHQIPQHTTKQDPPLPLQSVEAPKSQQGQQGQPRATEGPQTLSDEQINIEKLADEQLAKELDPGDADDIAATSSANPPANAIIDESSVAHTQPADGVADPSEKNQKELLPESEKEEKPVPVESSELSDVKEPGTAQIQSALSTAMLPPQNVPVGPAALYPNDHSQDYSLRGRGTGRGFFRGNSDYRGGMRGRGSTFHSNSTVAHPLSVQSSPVIDLPIHPPAEPKGLGVEGAPKAPRALREGLPNTGMRGGRGISIVGRAATNLPTRPNGPTRSRRFV